MKKRWLSLFLVCFLLLTALTLTLTATAGEETQDDEETQTDYASLYVQDGLTYFFFADGMTANQSVSVLENRVGENDLTKSTSGREYYNYLKPSVLSMKVTDDGKGVWFASYVTSQLDLTPVIPRDENGNMADVTIEISQKYLSSAGAGYGGSANVWGPFGKISYTRVNEGTFSAFPYTSDGRGPIKQWNSSSVFKEYDNVNSSSYKALFNHEAGAYFTTSFSFDYTASASDNVYDYVFVTGRNGAQIGTHTGSYNTETDYTPAHFYYNVDGNKSAGSIFTDDAVNCEYIVVPVDNDGNYVPLDGRTLNLAVSKNATSTLDTDPNDVITFSKVEFLIKDENGAIEYKKDGVTAEKYRKMTVADVTPVRKWGFTYGTSAATAFSSIRIYNRVLTAEEAAQNHFVDLAYALDADLSSYAEASEDVKKIVHDVFKTVNELTVTTEEFEEKLDALLLTGGKYPAEGFDNALAFLGYQMRLYGTPAIRSRFTVDMSAIDETEGFSIKEIGVLIVKADPDEVVDFEALSLVGGAEGYIALEGVAREIVYGEGVNTICDGIFGATIGADSENPIYTDEYVSRAYMIVSYKAGEEEKATFVSYCNAEGDEEGLGSSVSMFEMASALIDTYPESPAVSEIYFSQGADKEEALLALSSALDGAKAHYDEVVGRYDVWLNVIGTYKTDMVGYQKAALHAGEDADLTNAKNAAKSLKNTADSAYAEYTNYLSSQKDADMQTARELSDAVKAICTMLRFIADSTDDAVLLQQVKDALGEAEGYYQGLSRTILPKELTLSRAKTKIDSAYSALSNYILNTGVTARMYVLGDSTVCPRSSTSSVQGWVDHFKPSVNDSLEIINYAVGGWSFKGMINTTKGVSNIDIKNYTDEENSAFGNVLDVAGEGDFVVFASTSPNDLWQDGKDFFYKTDEFGNVTYAIRVSKSEQYFIDENGKRVDLTKDNCAQYGYEMYTWKATPNEYYHMLKECIDKTLALGATPILVTSCGGLGNTTATTRDFSITRDGVTTNYKAPIAIPGKITSNVEAYEEIKRILAAEYEGRVVLIDHTPLVFAEYEKFFDQAVIEANQIKAEKGRIDYIDEYVQKENISAQTYARYKLLSVYNADTSDNTHQGKAGATLVAEKILEILRDPNFDCDLKNYLVAE